MLANSHTKMPKADMSSGYQSTIIEHLSQSSFFRSASKEAFKLNPTLKENKSKRMIRSFNVHKTHNTSLFLKLEQDAVLIIICQETSFLGYGQSPCFLCLDHDTSSGHVWFKTNPSWALSTQNACQKTSTCAVTVENLLSLMIYKNILSISETKSYNCFIIMFLSKCLRTIRNIIGFLI